MAPTFTSSHEVSGLAGSSRAAVFNALYWEIAPAWDDLIRKSGEMAALLTAGRVKKTTMGRAILGVFRYGRPQSTNYAGRENTDFPAGKTGLWQNPEVQMKTKRSTLQFWGKNVRSSTKGKNAWINVKEDDIRSMMDAYEEKNERDLIGGKCQVRGVIKTRTGAGAFTLYGPNDRDSDAADWFKNGANWLRVGDALGLVTGSSVFDQASDAMVDLGQEAYVGTIDVDTDPDNPTITCFAADGTTAYDPNNDTSTDGDFLIPYGSKSNSYTTAATTVEAYHYGTNGMYDINMDADLVPYLYTITRSGVKPVTGRHFHGGGTKRTFTTMDILGAIRRTRVGGRNKIISDLATSPEIVETAVAENMGDRRFQPIAEGPRGYSPLVLVANGKRIPWNDSVEMPTSVIFGLETSSWQDMVQTPMQPLEPERWVTGGTGSPGKDAYSILWVREHNVVCKAPIDQFVYDDILGVDQAAA